MIKVKVTKTNTNKVIAKIEEKNLRVYEIQNHLNGNFIIYGEPYLDKDSKAVDIFVKRDDSILAEVSK
jgi:hypothetical protein